MWCCITSLVLLIRGISTGNLPEATTMDLTCMTRLSQLFEVFARLEAGESVALGAGGGEVVFPPPRNGVFLGVRSSGTTGIPKIVWRPWAGLRSETRVDLRTHGWHWASPFRPDSFAGVQAALQAWAAGGTIDSLSTNWDGVWAAHRSRPWDAWSATPTYLDLLVQNEPRRAGSGQECAQDPQQITLGGEVLRPNCGARLLARFPRTRFTVVYASAEWGVLLKTHRLDGWYEVESLKRRHPTWRVSDGAIELGLPDGTWTKTGDLVEVEGHLVRVIGRCDRVANVAGTKVNLDEIARMAELVPGVRRAVAVAEANPVTGQVIALRYSPESGADPVAVEKALGAALRTSLPKPAWPRRWVKDDLLPGRNAKQAL